VLDGDLDEFLAALYQRPELLTLVRFEFPLAAMSDSLSPVGV
jgi:hypothetical protein